MERATETMTTVYLPLPLRPINLSQEPYSFIRLGEDFRNQSYQPGQVFDLTNNYILRNTYFQVEVIGFYRNMLLVKPTESGTDIFGRNLLEESKKRFWVAHNLEDYQEIPQEEYLSLLDSQYWSPNT